MKTKRILFIIEELGDITTSGAIVNYNLCKTIAKKYNKTDILTLDSASERIKNEWSIYGNLFTHPKDNVKKYQKLLLYFNKFRALLYLIIGNDVHHYNRIQNIKKFLKKNIDNYDVLILLSAGLGFTPHQSIFDNKKIKKKHIVSVYHDPFPLSAYPKPYKKNSKLKEYFKIKNLQESLNLSNTIIFPSLRLYEWYLNDYKININRVKIIPHSVSNTENLTENDFQKNTNKTIITHTGTLLKQRNPSTILEENEKSNSKLNFNFYGFTDKNVYEQIKKFESENIKIHKERISYKESLNILRQSDFLLLIESNGEYNPFLPTKFVDYINVEKPIIILSPKKSEVSRLVGSNYPFLSELNDRNKISNILDRKIKDKLEVKKALEILKTIKQNFSSSEILKEYNQILNQS